MEHLDEHTIESNAASYYEALGPGIVTGAADDDPSGIATYSQAGAQGGFQFLWLSLFTLPFMILVQEMCARIGIVTGRGLAYNMRTMASRPILYFCIGLLFITNTFNIGADLGAMASASTLLFPSVPLVLFVVFFAFLSLNLQIFIPYKKYARYLKWLTFVLFFYIVTAFALHLEWLSILHALLIPHFIFSKENIFLLTALLGTTISPYLFFWQTSQEVEETIVHDEERKMQSKKETIKMMHFDVSFGMVVSNIVMFFIIVVCGATLYTNGITTIQTASDAAMALRPFAGGLASLLFTLGIVGTGLVALPILAGSTSYAFSEAFGWNEGLSKKWNEAKAFYGTIALSVLIGLWLLFLNISPIKMLIYAAVLNGIIAPFILFFIVKIGSSERVMGISKNHPITTIMGWCMVIIMALSAIATLFYLL